MVSPRAADGSAILERAAAQWPQRPAIIRNGVAPLSFSGLHSLVRVEARRLREAGVAPGDLVALDGLRDLDMVVALHALWNVGGVVLPLNASLSVVERGSALRSLAPRWILRGDGGGLLQMGPWSDTGSPDGTAAVIQTSGSSGDPRGVCLTAGNLEAVNRASAARLGLGPDDRWLLSLSPAHVGGLALIHRATLLGSALVLPRGLDPQEIWRHVLQDGVTHASLVPTVLLRLVEWLEAGGPHQRAEEAGGAPLAGTAAGDIGSLKCLLVGGAGTPPDLVRRAVALGLPVALTYGLTQAASQVASASPGEVREHPDSAGRPLDGVEVVLQEVDAEGVGELWVRGPTVAAGYLGSDELLSDADGWLHTGDIARLDGEGRIYVVGRLGRRFISGGVNVEPETVERFLREQDGVLDAVVMGVPDVTWGERGEALVVPAPGAAPDPRRLKEACRGALQPAARPRRFVFVEALPLNANGKVDLPRARDLLGPGN